MSSIFNKKILKTDIFLMVFITENNRKIMDLKCINVNICQGVGHFFLSSSAGLFFK